MPPQTTTPVVTSVPYEAWRLLKKRPLKIALAIVLSLLPSLLIYYLITQYTSITSIPGTLFISIVPAFFVAAGIIGTMLDKVRDEMLEQIATTLGYTFAKNPPVHFSTGRIFNVGILKLTKYIMTGTYQDTEIKILGYTYTYGGREGHGFYQTIVCSSLSVETPHIIANWPDIGSDSDMEKILMEDVLTKDATVYIEKDAGAKIRTLLTTTIMPELVKLYTDFGFEISGKDLYLIHETFPYDVHAWENTLTRAQGLIDFLRTQFVKIRDA